MAHADTQTRDHDRFAEANGLNLYYQEHGEGEPLLLLHGGLGTSSDWDAVVPYLAKHFRVMTPDSRGHGRTDNPTETLSYQVMADDVVALSAALGLEKPAVCGWSDGGQIALDIRVHHPDAARALIAGGVRFQFTDDYVQRASQLSFRQADGRVDAERVAAAYPWTAALPDAHGYVYGIDHWKTLLQWSADMWLTPFDLSPENLQRISVPSLLVVGDHDKGFPVEESLGIFRQIADAELAVFPASDHSLPDAHPEAFASTVIAFLSRHGKARFG